MESEEYMNRKQQEAEIAEVSILIIITIIAKNKRYCNFKRIGSVTQGGVPTCTRKLSQKHIFLLLPSTHL